MSSITISIEVRIEADTEREAREYAASHSIDVSHARWHANTTGFGGRLYVSTTSSSLFVAPPALSRYSKEDEDVPAI